MGEKMPNPRTKFCLVTKLPLGQYLQLSPSNKENKNIFKMGFFFSLAYCCV
jgi:hypothetical protein